MNIENPFIKYRQTLVDNYSTALLLRLAVLSLYNGDIWQVPLQKYPLMDDIHYSIFLEMLAWHRKHGEDAVLMELCEELKSLELPK